MKKEGFCYRGKVAVQQSCDLLLLAALLFEADQVKHTVPSATL